MTLNIIDGSSCAKHSIEVEIGIACASRTLIAHSNPHPEIVKVRSKGRWARGEGEKKERGGGWLVTTRELWDISLCRGPLDTCIS